MWSDWKPPDNTIQKGEKLLGFSPNSVAAGSLTDIAPSLTVGFLPCCMLLIAHCSLLTVPSNPSPRRAWAARLSFYLPDIQRPPLRSSATGWQSTRHSAMPCA